MTDKKRTSVSLDPEVYQFLSQSEINQSGLINDLVKEYKDNEKRQVAALKLRYKHLVQEAEEAEDKAEKKREQAEEVRELLDDAESQETSEIKDVAEKLESVPKKPENPAVKHQANKHNMTPEELLERIDNIE